MISMAIPEHLCPSSLGLNGAPTFNMERDNHTAKNKTHTLFNDNTGIILGVLMFAGAVAANIS